MNTRKFRYDDPTGGGDDIILEVPEWVDEVPNTLRVYDNSNEAYVFSNPEEEVDDADAN